MECCYRYLSVEESQEDLISFMFAPFVKVKIRSLVMIRRFLVVCMKVYLLQTQKGLVCV